MAEQEVEYESDPEEAKLSLKVRRKEASDDEEEGGGVDERGRERREKSLRGGIDSDDESDGQGGVDDYDDAGFGEEVEEQEEEDYYEDEEEDMGVREYDEMEGEVAGQGFGRGLDDGNPGQVAVETDGEVVVMDQAEEEKNEKEPFAVPTVGAFYMHDDRFQGNSGGRNRSIFSRRKLWESKDVKKWGHDKFEEMDMQERYFEEGRKFSKGYNRGCGRGRGRGHGYPRGNRQRRDDGNNNQTLVPKTVRGRGPQRYQPLKNINGAPVQIKQSVKTPDKSLHAVSGRNSVLRTNKEPETVAIKKVASSLNLASLPFYPSGLSDKDVSLAQKWDAQSGITSRNVQSSVAEDGFSVQQPTSVRGKSVTDSVGMDKLYINNSVSSATPKLVNNVYSCAPSPPVIANQASHTRVHSRGLPLPGSTIFQPSPTLGHANTFSSQSQVHASIRNPVQSRNQPSLPASSGQYSQRTVNVSQGSPPKSNMSTNTIDTTDVDSSLETNKFKTVSVTKGKGMVQGGSRAPFVYGDAQAVPSGASMGAAHGGQNFPATPTFLPVMQFGGQHPGGIGVPAVGMAFPGYVANPKLGLSNSEMTWLPVLTGAGGALGTRYPYIAVDGAYHSLPAAQTSVIDTSSKESGSKPSNDRKPQQRPEILGDESRQRQNKPRRYSEMKFDQ